VIDVQVEALAESARRWKGTVQQAVEAALAAQGVEVAEISLTLLDDAAIRALNRDHLEHDWATDVLSFALYSGDEPVLGDVYLGVDQAERQAAEEGVPMVEEIARLAVHGTLHVLGFDHPEEAEGRADCEMYRVQEEIVASLDLAGEPA
jgi:probable rRNA maturation factor